MEQLQAWLRTQCEQNNLTWRDASMKAGLNPGAISAILKGQQPGLKTCKALANLFSVSVVLILQMAGHIDIMPNSPLTYDPLVQRLLANFQTLATDHAKRTVVSVIELMVAKQKRNAERADGMTKT